MLTGYEMEITLIQQGVKVAVRKTKPEVAIIFGLFKTTIPNTKAIEENKQVYFFCGEILEMTQEVYNNIKAEIKRRIG